MNVASHKRSPKVDFFKIGLGGESGELPIIGNQHSWIIKTLTAIKAMLGHANVSCKHFQTQERLDPNTQKVLNNAIY